MVIRTVLTHLLRIMLRVKTHQQQAAPGTTCSSTPTKPENMTKDKLKLMNKNGGDSYSAEVPRRLDLRPHGMSPINSTRYFHTRELIPVCSKRGCRELIKIEISTRELMPVCMHTRPAPAVF